MVSQILTFCLKFYNSSSCDFNRVVLLLSSSFSSCSFLMSTLIFCSTSTLLFLQISTLCLYPFLMFLSLSNSSYNIAFSFSLVANLFKCLLPKSNSPYSNSQLPWSEITHLCALKFVLSCSFFTPQPEAPPSSTLFFLLRAFLGKFVATFFLFSNVVCISSLVLLTLVGDFCGPRFDT